MALVRVFDYVWDEQGNIVPGVKVSVLEAGGEPGSGAPVPIFLDKAGTQAVDFVETLPADTPAPRAGSYALYVAPGEYDLKFEYPGFDPWYTRDQTVPGVGAAGTSFTWRPGGWAIGTAYALNDVVAHAGGVYIALAPSTGQAPGSSPMYWDVMISDSGGAQSAAASAAAAALSATAADTSAQASAASATAADGSAGDAAASAGTATTQATAAGASAGEAGASADASAASAGDSETSAAGAATSAGEAATSADGAAGSATAAAGSATAAGTQAGNAAASATAAAGSATAAATSETNAAGSATAAAGSATAAAGSATTATADATATAADRTAVHADKLAADADATATAADRTATHADRLQADADATATAADRTATHADKLAADASATNASNSAIAAATSASAAGDSAVNAAASATDADADAAAATDALAKILAANGGQTTAKRMTAVADSGHLTTYDYTKVNGPITGYTNVSGKEGGWVKAIADAGELELKFPDLLCIGDSQAYHVSTHFPNAPLLFGLNLVNIGVGGTSSAQVLTSLAGLTEDQKSPQVIFISAGTNDTNYGMTLDDTKANVLAIIEIIRTYNCSNIIWLGSPPVSADHSDIFSHDECLQMKALSEWMETIAPAYGITFYNHQKHNCTDYAGDDFTWKAQDQMSFDGLHMTSDGYFGVFLDAARQGSVPLFCAGLTILSRNNNVTGTANVYQPGGIAVDWNGNAPYYYRNPNQSQFIELPIPRGLSGFGTIGKAVTGGYNGITVDVVSGPQLCSGVCAAYAIYGTRFGGIAPADQNEVVVNDAAGTSRHIYLMTKGFLRWALIGGSDAETGSDAGTTFTLAAYADSGVLLDAPLVVLRAAGGAMTFGGTTSRPATFKGTVATLDDITVGADTSAVRGLNLNAAAGNFRSLRFKTASVLRWALAVDNVAEAGADAGSAIGLSAYKDDGTFIDTPINIVRAAAGAITIGGAAARPTTLTGDTTVGTATGTTRRLGLNAAAANYRSLVYLTGGVLRWAVAADSAAEGGANAGSAFGVAAYDDAGAIIDTPFYIVRVAGGLIQLGGANARPVTSTGDLTVGLDAGTTRIINLNAAAGNFRTMQFKTASVLRWLFGADNAAEAGSNAGTALGLSAYSDAGVIIDTPISIVRASGGAMSFGGSTSRPATFTGALTANGDFQAGTDTGTTRTVILNAAAGNARNVSWRTAGSLRWLLSVTNSAESGSNVGSGMILNAYSDAGAYIDTPITIVRAASGLMTIGRPVKLVAGVAAAGGAPLLFTTGVNLTSAVAGAMEYNGTNLFFTRTAGTRENVLCGTSGAAAPATTNIGVIVDYYGSSATRVLTTPNSWGSVNIGGTVYKVPLYT